VVGVITNLFSYLIYLLVTFLWLEPKIAVSIMYPIAAILALFGHARHSFSMWGVLRYCLVSLAGYGINITMLYVCVDKLNYPHQFIQIFAVITIACIQFILMKYFVFPGIRKKS
jgi:putative flippase GtrA